MSTTEHITDPRVPALGPNKLKQAMDDWDIVVAENAHLKTELAQYVDIANKLSADNDSLRGQIKAQGDFFTHRIDILTQHRDRLQTMLKGWLTRVNVVEECLDTIRREARDQAINEVNKTDDAEDSPEQNAALQRLDLANPDRRLPSVGL